MRCNPARVAPLAALLLLGARAAGQAHVVPEEVDWRSRAQVGLRVQYEWEWSHDSMMPGSGGTGFGDRGTLVDQVYSEEGDDVLGVRLVTHANGARTGVRFFRLLPSGELVDDAPLESFCWQGVADDLPHHDPLGKSNELVPGLARERSAEIRDPLFRAVFPDPVPVHESVELTIPADVQERYRDQPEELQDYLEWATREQPGYLRRTVRRTWKAPDGQGLASASGAVRLLALDDVSTISADGRIVERTLEFSYLRQGDPMVQTTRRTIREVDFRSEPTDDGPSALLLRDAFRLAPTDPREACRRLTAWARSGPGFGFWSFSEVAAQIWLLTAQAEREHAGDLAWARREAPAAEAALAVADDDTFEALRRGRLGALFTQLGLDGASHRAAYRASLERRGLDAPTVSFLMRLHDLNTPADDEVVPEPQRSQAGALFESALRELAHR